MTEGQDDRICKIKEYENQQRSTSILLPTFGVRSKRSVVIGSVFPTPPLFYGRTHREKNTTFLLENVLGGSSKEESRVTGVPI